MKDFEDTIKRLGKTHFLSVYVCQPYSILIGCYGGKLFVIDTHPVLKIRNTHTSVLIVAEKSNYKKYCQWIWKRLYESNISKDELQTLSTIQLRKEHNAWQKRTFIQ